MGLAVLVERREHDWQDDGGVVADEGHDVLVVPVVQRTLSNLHILRLSQHSAVFSSYGHMI